MDHSFPVLFLIIFLFYQSFVLCRHHGKTVELFCNVCDTLNSSETDCFQLPDKKKYSIRQKMGVLGWPVCYTIKSLDKTVAQRGMIQEFDGTPYWKPNFDGCRTFYDDNLELKMEVCICITDNCNDK
ncbi:uncharacterized protein LOC110863433 [Folsomia candida]|uniref:Protein sleepless n=1 Tax=Folsomia candida TaxID=158441 RepID=A0A226EXQ6_FOLCA|nr:uncharacterized protein LOC110863433 [Folsomia candida]XP_035702859.1 uncharacterized protein LOC110863433 [Folsomia candida]OXA61854.1 hypothetical protein Fcan01_02659 [Folsomia candida]